MANRPNKVKFGLSSVHYAAISDADSGITYAVPAPIPGGVNLTLAPQGDTTPFYADDSEYFTSIANNGYDGTLEIALIPEGFAKEILGEELDAKNVLFENADVITQPFALLFQFKGDVSNTRHVLYYCKATRPNIDGSTKGASLEVKTETLNLTARPHPDTKYVKAKTTSDTDKETYDSWFTAVHVKAAETGV